MVLNKMVYYATKLIYYRIVMHKPILNNYNMKNLNISSDITNHLDIIVVRYNYII